MEAFEVSGGSGEVTHIHDVVVDVAQVEVDERGNLGFLCQDLCIRVDEERAGDGIGAIIHGSLGGFNTFNCNSLQFAGVLREVSKAEVTNGVGAAFHALNEHVVIFRELCACETEQSFFASGLTSALPSAFEVERSNNSFD